MITFASPVITANFLSACLDFYENSYKFVKPRRGLVCLQNVVFVNCKIDAE